MCVLARLRWGLAAGLATVGFLGCLATAQAQPEIEGVRSKGGIEINEGITGAWFNPATAGQGFLVDIEPASQFIFIAWFTYEGTSAKLGAFEHRWLTAQGNYSGNTAQLPLFVTSGGLFDDPQGVTTEEVGSLMISLTDCINGLIEYDLPDEGLQGQIPITRVIPGTEELCEMLVDFGQPTLVSTVDDPDNRVGEFTSLAIGADGLPVISYHDRGADALKVAKCNDPACSGFDETITTVDSMPEVGFVSSIAIGVDGLPVISYADFRILTLAVAKCNDPACAGGDETLTRIDASNEGGGGNSLAIGADGLPVISYATLSARDLKVAKCNDAACSGGDETITTVDHGSLANPVGGRTSLAIGADGLPVISYSKGGALRVAKCNDPACFGGDETITTVDDPANGLGQFFPIAIGADGLPVITYTVGTNPSNLDFVLKVAKCNDPACSGGDETITTADDPANHRNDRTSIAIGVDGLPVISYLDRTAGALKVAKCNDPACSGGDETITTVDDSDNFVGDANSIVIGADGLPVISYHDTTAGALKVAKCGNPACR